MRRWRNALAAAALGMLAASGAIAKPAPQPADLATLRAHWQPSQAWLLDRHGELLQTLRTDPHGLRLPWVALDDVSPAFIDALVAVEDQRFWQHHGVDWRALIAAAWQNLTSHRRRGASTLTMQLAGLLHSGRATREGRRTLAEKWAQLRAAQAIEARMSKRDILEAYINEVGFRGELRGIGAASEGLFGKAPAGLDSAEALLLATLVATPNRAPDAVASRACALARAHALPVPCAALQQLATRTLGRPPRLAGDTDDAPHLAHRLLRTPGERVTSTLDAPLQRRVRAILREQLQRLDGRNVRDAAAVVLDNASGDVLAWVGSGGPRSTAPAVDGVLAPRQAGSTLKPFLYGLAFERRFLTPASLVEDTPINLETATGLYIPQNYDRDFKGVVSARSALGSSLNVPAVRTLVLVGVESLRARLFDVGYRGIVRDGEFYGYSLALGSAEVSLLQQAEAYRALANGGRYGPSRLRMDAPPAPQSPVMAPGAAFLVGDVLADAAARALTFGLDNPLALPFWAAVKTGTSKDMRDNWCVGYSTRYTVAVWVGNFEGDSMQDVSGVSGAAPAWAAIMHAAHEGAAPPAPAPPADVVSQDVTFDPAIEAPRREWFLAGTQMPRVALLTPAARGARIASPANGVVIALDPDIPVPRQRVTLTARGAPPGATWRLDDRPLGHADAYQAWAPQPGTHTLELRSGGTTLDTVRFTVRAAR